MLRSKLLVDLDGRGSGSAPCLAAEFGVRALYLQLPMCWNSSAMPQLLLTGCTSGSGRRRLFEYDIKSVCNICGREMLSLL
jgi:hypothetical protein